MTLEIIPTAATMVVALNTPIAGKPGISTATVARVVVNLLASRTRITHRTKYQIRLTSVITEEVPIPSAFSSMLPNIVLEMPTKSEITEMNPTPAKIAANDG